MVVKSDRFDKVFRQGQGTMEVMEIWVDKETGVNYLVHIEGAAGGMTVLLDQDGKPVVSPVRKR